MNLDMPPEWKPRFQARISTKPKVWFQYGAWRYSEIPRSYSGANIGFASVSDIQDYLDGG